VGRRLSNHYRVVHYEWDSAQVARPGPDDVLLGHPHPAPWTVFRRSAKQQGWKRVIILSPYCHGDLAQVAFLDPIVPRCDLYLAITGNHWYSSAGHSAFSHWFPKMVHVDLAVDRADFPVLKKRFKEPGRRSFLYIGHTAWYKNTAYLSEIARLMPDTEIGWIGSGVRDIPGLTALGRHDFSGPGAKHVISQYDFMLTVGRADANPATILESMAWGLIPVCTVQSGYVGYPGIPNIPLDDAPQAVEILKGLQFLPQERLNEMQQANWDALDTHFNWNRFANQVIEAVESDDSPSLAREPLSRKLLLRYAALVSPYSVIRPWVLRQMGHVLLKGAKRCWQW